MTIVRPINEDVRYKTYKTTEEIKAREYRAKKRLQATT